MEIGVYYGGRLDRLEEITKNLERETEVTWGNGDDPSDLGGFNAKAFSYLLYDNKSTRCLTVGDYCDNEVSAADFVAKVKEEHPKEELEFIPGHLYRGEFSDAYDLFEGICACYEDNNGDVSLVSISTNENEVYYFWVKDLDSPENATDITEEVISL